MANPGDDGRLISVPNLEAAINSATKELCSIKLNGREFMWGGGRPKGQKGLIDVHEQHGWPHSAIIMFPLVGSPEWDGKDHKYITIDGEQYPMQQHGIARHIDMFSDERGSLIRTWQKHDGTPITVRKDGKDVEMHFPYQYALNLFYTIQEGALVADFELFNGYSGRDMPFSLGWHPAFNTLAGGEIECNYKIFNLHEVWEEGVIIVPQNKKLIYRNEVCEIEIAHNFGNMMIWSPDPSLHRIPLVCFETITGVPTRKENGTFVGNWDSQLLRPGETKDYQVKITPRFLE